MHPSDPIIRLPPAAERARSGPRPSHRLHLRRPAAPVAAPRRVARLLAAAGVTLITVPAHAIDPFEIQVYDGTANRPARPGLELHVNHVFAGPRARAQPDPSFVHLTTFTLEPSVGVFDFWELGGYLQSALLPSGEFDYAGVKLRSKFVTGAHSNGPLRLGINLEFSVLPRSYDRDRYGGEIRPIVAWEDERWLLAVNPILGLSFGGDDAGHGPTFEPCFTAKRKLGAIAIGIEYYAGLGPIGRPLGWSAQDQYLYETIDMISLPRVEVNLGAGEGLNAASNRFVMKLNLGYVWEPLPTQSGAQNTLR